jgi:hypothetical protein
VEYRQEALTNALGGERSAGRGRSAGCDHVRVRLR